MAFKSSPIPPNNRWIKSARDLPRWRSDRLFHVTSPDGRQFEDVLRKRQVGEALMLLPIYCTSPLRLSHEVGQLKHEYCINIETLKFQADTGTVIESFGVYVLTARVEHCD